MIIYIQMKLRGRAEKWEERATETLSKVWLKLRKLLFVLIVIGDKLATLWHILWGLILFALYR